MRYEPEVFVRQFPLVKQFVHHLIYYRELVRVYRDLHLKSAFWTATIDAHLSRASLLWCMVFGSEGSNQYRHLCAETQIRDLPLIACSDAI